MLGEEEDHKNPLEVRLEYKVSLVIINRLNLVIY